MEKTIAASSLHEEHQYLNLIRDILANGEHRPDRYEAYRLRFLLYLPAKDFLGQEQALFRSLLLLRFASPSLAQRSIH